MPKAPDFKALAYRVASMHCESITGLDDEIGQYPDALNDTIAILREVWNARGAADIAKIDASPHVHTSLSAALGLTLRGLDR